jgi:catalase (peroxidase I)
MFYCPSPITIHRSTVRVGYASIHFGFLASSWISQIGEAAGPSPMKSHVPGSWGHAADEWTNRFTGLITNLQTGEAKEALMAIQISRLTHLLGHSS